MGRLIHAFHVFALALSVGLGSYAQAGVVQIAVVVDASSSTEGELPTFRAGVANALSLLKTDGSVELTLVQFSAEALTLVNADLIESPADVANAVAQANLIDPALTAIPPFNGGTNFDDAFIKATAAITNSPRFGTADYQFINMLTDGNPTTHNQLGLADLDEATRKTRARQFGKDSRDDALAAGIDVISFEALGPPNDGVAGIPYLQTLTAPGSPFTVSGNPPTFPDPIESQGFIFEIGGVSDIEAALTAKLAAADLIIPEPGTIGLAALGSLILIRRRV